MSETSGSDQTDGTLQLFPAEIYQTQTLSWADFLVQLLALLENGQDFPWRTHEALSLLRCLDLLTNEEYLTFSLRMSKDFSITMEGEPSESSSPSWMAWGMTASGNCLTAKTSESRNTERGFSLSQILEENPDPKYFLSESQVERMMKRTRKNQEEGRGFSPTFLQP